MIKNKYISETEVERILSNVKEDRYNFKKMIELVYCKGIRIGEANKQTLPPDIRAKEIMLKRICKRLKMVEITFRDLRKAYLLNNPEEIIKLLEREKKNRNPISAKVRWKVLERDNFKCVACGISSKETTLQVDHINPVSNGGEDDINNYQTLCPLCNIGKFSKIPNMINVRRNKE